MAKANNHTILLCNTSSATIQLNTRHAMWSLPSELNIIIHWLWQCIQFLWTFIRAFITCGNRPYSISISLLAHAFCLTILRHCLLSSHWCGCLLFYLYTIQMISREMKKTHFVSAFISASQSKFQNEIKKMRNELHQKNYRCILDLYKKNE